MEAKWFNVYGLIFVAVILIPNVIFAMKCKDGFVNKWNTSWWKPWSRSDALAALS